MNKPSLQEQLETAIKIAVDAHAGQVDKAGMPYILHPLEVMRRCQKHGIHHQMVAVLHDVLEDTEVTSRDLHEAGLPDTVVMAVVAISKSPNDSYDQYLLNVRNDPGALKVKIEDIGHNLSRLENLDPDHAAYLAKKYVGALKFLNSV
jgi:(p)ppGpp synthase/HD superfamily hydrolase